MVDGEIHHFSAGGLYNGLVLLIDDETLTYWDHMTGEALHGPLAGRVLPRWSLQHTTVGAALENDPSLQVLRPRPASLVALLMRWLHRSTIGKKGFLPPGFRKTMAEVDPRMPEMEQGLGVMSDGQARFFATRDIGDGIDGSREVIERDFKGVPRDELEAMVGGNAAALYGLAGAPLG